MFGTSLLATMAATTNTNAEDFKDIKGSILTGFRDSKEKIEKIRDDFFYGCLQNYAVMNYNDKKEINMIRCDRTRDCENGYYKLLGGKECFFLKEYETLINLIGKLKEISLVDTYKLLKILTEFEQSLDKYRFKPHIAYRTYCLITSAKFSSEQFIKNVSTILGYGVGEKCVFDIQEACEKYVEKANEKFKDLEKYMQKGEKNLALNPDFFVSKEKAELDQIEQSINNYVKEHPEYKDKEEKLKEIDNKIADYLKKNPELNINSKTSSLIKFKRQREKILNGYKEDDHIKKLKQKKEDCLKRCEKNERENPAVLSREIYKNLYSVIDYGKEVEKEYEKFKNKVENLKKFLEEKETLKEKIKNMESKLSNETKETVIKATDAHNNDGLVHSIETGLKEAEQQRKDREEEKEFENTVEANKTTEIFTVQEEIGNTIETDKTTEISTIQEEKGEKGEKGEKERIVEKKERTHLEDLKSKLELLNKNISAIYEEAKKFVRDIEEKYKQPSGDYEKWEEELNKIRFVDESKETKKLAEVVENLYLFLNDFTERLGIANTAEELLKGYSVKKEVTNNGLINNEIILDEKNNYLENNCYVIEKKTTIPLGEDISRVRVINVSDFFDPKDGDVFLDYEDYVKLENDDVKNIVIDKYEKDYKGTFSKIKKRVNFEELKKIVQDSFVCFNLSYDKVDYDNYGFKKIFGSCENKDSAFRYHFSKEATKKMLEIYRDKDLFGRKSLVMLRNKRFINLKGAFRKFEQPLSEKSKEFINRINNIEYKTAKLLIREEGKEDISFKGNRVSYQNYNQDSYKNLNDDYETFSDNLVHNVNTGVEGTASDTIADDKENENDTKIHLGKDVYCVLDQQTGFLTISCGTEREPYTQIDKFESIFKNKITNNNVFETLMDKTLAKDINVGIALKNEDIVEIKEKKLKEKLEKDDKGIKAIDGKIEKLNTMIKKINQVIEGKNREIEEVKAMKVEESERNEEIERINKDIFEKINKIRAIEVRIKDQNKEKAANLENMTREGMEKLTGKERMEVDDARKKIKRSVFRALKEYSKENVWRNDV